MKLGKLTLVGAVITAGLSVATIAGASAMVPTKATFAVKANGHSVAQMKGTTMMRETATGRFAISSTANDVCYVVAAHNLGMITSATINLGMKGDNGMTEVHLNAHDITAAMMHIPCITISHSLATKILAHPANHYFQLANEAHPHGAVRSQL